MTTTTDTHCPYCSLQCGMRVATSGGVGTTRSSNGPTFPVNRGALCGKGQSAAALLDRTGPADHAAGPRPRGELRPAGWDEALDRVAAGLSAIRSSGTAPDAVAVFGGGGLTNEKAYLLGKFARVALRHRQHRLQRPVLHVLGRGGAAGARSASTAGCRSRWRTSPRTGLPAAGRREPGRDHAAAAALLPRTARERRPADRGRPAAHPPPPNWPTCTCNRCPAPTWRSRSGCCTS